MFPGLSRASHELRSFALAVELRRPAELNTGLVFHNQSTENPMIVF